MNITSKKLSWPPSPQPTANSEIFVRQSRKTKHRIVQSHNLTGFSQRNDYLPAELEDYRSADMKPAGPDRSIKYWTSLTYRRHYERDPYKARPNSTQQRFQDENFY